MATTTNKQRLVTQLFTAYKKAGEPADTDALPVLEQFIYGLCREGTTRERADEAFRTLRERFFDWNEIRVSSPREVEEAFADLPRAVERAHRLISFLQEVFETTFSYDLESLQKKGMKQAAKQLSRYQAATPYVVGWVVQQSLGGHAIPVDEPTLRSARRMGLVEEGEGDTEAIQASLEHLIPKARGLMFGEAISHLAEDHCWEDSPNCCCCPLSSDCPTGQQAGQEAVAAAPARGSRVKPR